MGERRLRVFPKPCLKCKAIFTFRSEYCDTCRLERKPREQKPRIDTPARRIKKSILYGSNYRGRAQAVRDSATHCHICLQPFLDRTQIQADHLIPGNPESPLAAAHRVCNARKGNRYIG